MFALSLTVLVNPSSAQQPLSTVIILPDGTVSPSTAPITQNEDAYTFTDNLYARIIIQKSNIVVNGAGYTLRGPYNGTATNNWVVGEGPNQDPNGTFTDYIIGVDFGGENIDGITIENLNIKNFSIGMYVWTENNTVKGNNFSDNIVGILVSGSNQTITDNYIANNQRGLFFGFNNKVTNVIPQTLMLIITTLNTTLFSSMDADANLLTKVSNRIIGTTARKATSGATIMVPTATTTESATRPT